MAAVILLTLRERFGGKTNSSFYYFKMQKEKELTRKSGKSEL
jgi:hypothetical protein